MSAIILPTGWRWAKSWATRRPRKVSARESEIGYLPYVKDIDIEGLENDGKEFTHMMLDELLTVDKELWREDAENIESFYASIGDRLPAKLREELETLKKNLQ